MFACAQIRFLGDPGAEFTKALDLDFDGTAIFGGPRSKRYAPKVVDGKVAAAHVEPDGTGYKGMYTSWIADLCRMGAPLLTTSLVSMAEKVLD